MVTCSSVSITPALTIKQQYSPKLLVVLALSILLLLPSFVNNAAAAPQGNLTEGCIERYDPTVDYFPEKATLAYTEGFTLEYFEHYKVVTVKTPWPNADETFRYVLVQCGAPTPENIADAQVVQIPVRSIAMLSTTHLAHLESLSALDRLIAVGPHESVYSPAVREKIAAGSVAEVGRGPSINLEMVLDLRPELVTAAGHDQPQYNTHPLLLNAGVNVAINAEYVEMSYATGAIVSILIYFSVPEQIQAYIAWTFGSFGGVTQRQLIILAPLIGAGLLLAGLLVKPLNAMLLGETYARSMGVNVSRIRFWMIVGTAVLAGVVTAFCGPIGFLGVAVPHLCRALFHSSDHRVLIPATLLMGGIIALLADLVAGLPGSEAVLPLNAVTALLGAPVVVWIIISRGRVRSPFAS